MNRQAATAMCACAFAAAASLPPSASAAPATDPPYQIPAGPQDPMVPLVAAITLPRGQKLGMVLDDGLRLRLFAYRRIKVSVTARLTRKTAKRLHMRGRPRVAGRNYDFAQRGVYGLRLRLTPRVIERLRHQRRAGFLLRTVLEDAKSSTTATTPITLRR